MLNTHIFSESFTRPILALVLLIGLLVAYVSLWLGKELVKLSGRQRLLRLMLASLILGGGYWLQNFIVISQLVFADTFKAVQAFLWFATPLITALFAYYIATRFRLSNSSLIAGGVATGLGSSATPLMGLASLDTSLTIALDANFLIFVVLLGVAVSIMGLSAAFHLFKEGFSFFSWKFLLATLGVGFGLTSLQFIVLAGINTAQGDSDQGFIAIQSLPMVLLLLALPLAVLMLVLQRREQAKEKQENGYAVEPIYIGFLVSLLIVVCLILASRWLLLNKVDYTTGLTQAGYQAQRHFQEAYTAYRDWRSDHPGEPISADILDKLSSSRKDIQVLLEGGELDGIRLSAINDHQSRQRLNSALQDIESLQSTLQRHVVEKRVLFSEAEKDAFEPLFQGLSEFFAMNRQAVSQQLGLVNVVINQATIIRILFVVALFSLLAIWYRRFRVSSDQQNRLLEDTLKELVLQKGALDQHAIVSIADESGFISYANDKFCEISGYERDELIGRSHNLLNSGYHSREFFRELWQTITSGRTWRGEINNRNKAGDCYWVQTTIVPFLDEAGKPYQYISIRTDISQLKEAEKALWDYNQELEKRVHERTAELVESHEIIEQEKLALEESENRLRMSQRFAKMGSWDWDIESGDIHWSEQVPHLFGYQAGETIASYDDLIRAIDPQDRDNFLEAIDECLSNGTHYDIEHRVSWPDGSIHWLQERGDVVRDEQGKPVRMLGVVADVTRRKRQAEALQREKEEQATLLNQLKEAQSQLLQSEKMASLGQLAAGVAHEINNPVGYINSNIGTLQQYMGDLSKLIEFYQEAEAQIRDEQTRQSLQQFKDRIDLEFIQEDLANLITESQEGVSRVKQIVQDLKDFSHVDTADWQQADLHRGLDSTLNIVHNELKYKAKIVKEYAELPKIECIPSQLNQVFMNMLVNAGHAIEDQGEIRLRTGTNPDDTVWVEIEDSGKGMSQEDMTRIFDPFFTTKPVGKGTGLGLSISYNIIKKHGGSIDVDSEKGRGTRFRVTLPVSQAADRAAEG